ncbi:Transcriptional regulator CtsR [Neomoorella glycerini]|uniref:Transcriptional regulator CtsR n=1 Tax=Neomoorella glycerini TaxID=55779 RepID=A0A6I5ZQQ4_9FIRM|nr:CtsR family transcriptional regulator [Moorella glycerini]QGP92160.1 Transcriptional regulator CtsR [Moorella glycerini]
MEGKTLADRIENYIKWLLKSSADGIVELQRQELAERFTCVPSQISYVLSTRFTIERGYLVESRRGGGGYIRIARVPLNAEERLKDWVHEALGEYISQEAAVELLERLGEEGLLTRREQLLLAAAINRQALPLELPRRDQVRACIMKAIILTLMRDDFPSEG